MDTLVQKTPIREILVAMEVNDSASYPNSRRDSVTTTRDQLQVIHPTKKWVLSKIDNESFLVTRKV